jgi:hypothetical protein
LCLSRQRSVLKCYTHFKRDRPDLTMRFLIEWWTSLMWEQWICIRLNPKLYLQVGRSVIYCIITKKSLADTKTTKRGKSEKWNDFFKRDLTEIIRALNKQKRVFFFRHSTGNSEEFIRIYRGPNYFILLYKVLKSIGFLNTKLLIIEKFFVNKNTSKFQSYSWSYSYSRRWFGI